MNGWYIVNTLATARPMLALDDIVGGWYAAVAFVVAWLIAQTWKTLAGVLSGKAGKMSFSAFVWYATRSGGMPSGHTAAMTALTVCLGQIYGFNSGLFILSLASTLIVVYDATHVRYAVGVQGEALNELLEKDGKKPLRIVEGHTIPQALVGALIGIITGVVMGILMKA